MAGRARLHIRLAAIFSLMASVPIILTVIVAAFMFQSGAQFWQSDRAQTAFNASLALAEEGQSLVAERWAGETRQITEDIRNFYPQIPVNSREFETWFGQQTFYRNLEESVLFTFDGNKSINVLYQFNPPSELLFLKRANPGLINALKPDKFPFVDRDTQTIWVLTDVPGRSDLYLYTGTSVNVAFLNKQVGSADAINREYAELRGRAQTLQWQYNGALLLVALLIIGVATWIALTFADRLVRPIDQLVTAARRIARGDLTARVAVAPTKDEIETLGVSFNSMAEQLENQTGALVSANAQAESRRALIEAVMSGVSAGVISVDAARNVRVINESARELLRHGEANPVGRPLAEIAPELDHVLASDTREDVIQLSLKGEARTLAVKITGGEGGQVLTFDDITQQVQDQRRAAWSDVARRIAHEIKNPLTPIQLAAERLQRRYGRKIDSDDGTFAKLTETIVRQVGDLRRMVDEFSSFARMPKPVFREESLLDLARQALFLHEVAHPDIRFSIEAEEVLPALVCDRRQIGQALTNIVKNAVEAVEARPDNAKDGEIEMRLSGGEDGQLLLEIADNGVGLPVERDRIIEPYMTTRARGTGLGLAIVKKIIDEHFGTMTFSDRQGGGTVVTLCFDPALLADMAGSGDDDARGDAALAMLTRNSNG